jgi:hypothetical protein
MENLTQYEYLDRDAILKGVCEWIVKESPVIGKLPFKSIQGNAYKYNVELTLPGASWMDFDQQVVTTSGSVAQRTTDIFMLLQDSNTPKANIDLNSTQDPEKADIALAAKAMAHEFENAFIRGQTSTLSTTKQFKGLMRMLAELETATTTDWDGPNNEQVVVNSTTSAVLTLAAIDALIDQIKPGKPDMLLMGRRTHRKITALQRASGGGVVMTDPNEFGQRMNLYDGIPMLKSDFMPENLPDATSSITTISTWNPATTWTDGANNGAIIAIQLGEDKVCGLQAGEMKHEREEFVEDYHAIKNRFVWLCGAAAFRKYSLAALVNIDTSA